MEGDLLRALAHGLEDEVRAMSDKLRWGVALYTEAPAARPASPAKAVRRPARSQSGRGAAPGSAG